jgi:hypothetical protein
MRLLADLVILKYTIAFSVEGVSSGYLGDWMDLNADEIETCTQTYLQNLTHSAELDAAAVQLTSGIGTITLNRLSMLYSPY